jgi:hypothetical protein
LGILLKLEESDLVMLDEKTGEQLLSRAEAAEKARKAAEVARKAAEAARKAADARVAQLEAELESMRATLKRKGRGR